jgi:hypothetical protein
MPFDNKQTNTDKDQDKLIREAHARGLPPWSSPSPEKAVPMSVRLRILGVIGAIVMTAAIGIGILYLIGVPL